MQGLVTMIAASAVLSAGLVAGLAATDAVARPKPATTAAPVEAPAAKGPALARPAGATATAPCAAAWPYTPATCAADGRKVRIIALGGQ